MKLPDFLIIPSQLLTDKEITPLDGYVYGVIYWAARLKNEKCTMSNQTIANLLQVTASGIANSLTRLRKKQYISVLCNEKKERVELVPLIAFEYSRPSSNKEGGVPQIRKGGSSNKEQNNNNEEDINNRKNSLASQHNFGSDGLQDYRIPHSIGGEKTHSNPTLEPLPYSKLWEIAMKKNVSLEAVQEMHQRVLDSIEEGNKYKIEKVGLALQKWLSMAIDRKTVERLSDEGRMVLEWQNPARKEKLRKELEKYDK